MSHAIPTSPIFFEELLDDGKKAAVLEWIHRGATVSAERAILKELGYYLEQGTIYVWGKKFCMLEWHPGHSRWVMRPNWGKGIIR